MDEKIHLGTLRLSSVSRNTKRGDTGLIFKVWIAYPVLDVQLAELAVGLDLAVGAGYLFHEGAQLHGLGNQRPAHGPEVGVRLWGERQVMSAIIIYYYKYLIPNTNAIHDTQYTYILRLHFSRQEPFEDCLSYFCQILSFLQKSVPPPDTNPRSSHPPIPHKFCEYIVISERYVCIIIIILNDVIRASESQSVITLAFY